MQLIEVEISNKKSIKLVRADYIILKNITEGIFGPELSINKALGGLIDLNNTSQLTKIGAVKTFHSIKGIAAKNIVLVGADSGFELSYETISVICSVAIDTIAQSSPTIKTVATVSHGVGFLLDRIEVFKSQLFSIKSSLEEHKGVLQIEKIIFNEINSEDANQLITYLEKLSVEKDSPITKRENKFYLKLGFDSTIVDYFSSKLERAQYVFIAIPFKEEFNNVYDFGIRLPIEINRLLPIRIDRENFLGSIIDEIKKRIRNCLLIIADISTANPNVLFELGFAQGCGKPSIILSRKDEKLPFDVSGMKVIFYNPNLIRELNESINNALKTLLKKS